MSHFSVRGGPSTDTARMESSGAALSLTALTVAFSEQSGFRSVSPVSLRSGFRLTSKSFGGGRGKDKEPDGGG